MAEKIKGKISDLYSDDIEIIKKIMSESSVSTHIKNLGYQLQVKGVIKDPHNLYAKIENYIAQAIVLYKINE